MNTFRSIHVALLAMIATAAVAQTPSSVLKESQVTESRLIEALRPADTAPSGDAVPGERSRSIRVSAAARPASQASKPSSAAVLITFETNSAELTPAARQSLDVVARALNDQQLAGLTFSIEGHADLRGTPDENLRLSQARAESVRQYLIGTRNVDAARLRAVGKGDREPINTREVAAPENRRVTFVTQQQ